MKRLSLATLILAAVVCSCASRDNTGVFKQPGRPPAPPPVPAVRKEPLNPALQEQARKEIRDAFASNDPIMRADAIEAAQNTFGADAREIVSAGLGDKDGRVRFAAALAAGVLKFSDLHDRLWSMSDDPSPAVQVAVRFALHRLGDTRLSQELVKLAVNENPGIREYVAMVFGMIGEPSALKVLQQMAPKELEPDVRIQIAASRWKAGNDEEGLQVLVAGMVSRYVDDQMTCLIAMSGPRDQRIAEYIRGKLTEPYTEVTLVAARALGELGFDDGYGVAMQGVRSTDPRQRFLAAFALGAIGRSDAQSSLTSLLKDSDPHVRLAAATAVLELKEPPVQG